MRKKVFLLSVLLLSVCMKHSLAQTKGDKLLQLLQDELKYNYGELQKQDVKPYFMSYRVEDNHTTTITSAFGVVSDNSETHKCNLTPQVRVGDMQLDNYKYANQAGNGEISISYEGDIADGIRHDIWRATMRNYMLGLVTYQNVKSKALTSNTDEDMSGCFSTANVKTYYEDPLPESMVHIDRNKWAQKLNEVSAVFKEEPLLQVGSATISFGAVRTWLVNSEGTSVVQNRVTARIMLNVKAQANDGMELPLMQDFFAFSPDSLPSRAVLIATARDLMKRVIALRNAPVANPYTGPAILSGPASGVFFHEIFGHRLESHRLKQGGETFRKMVNKRVLPEAFQVFSDPTLKKYHGQDLNGHYLYDSEGVKARRVNNVVDGVLKEFLMSRVPLDGFPTSNGHGRASASKDAVSRQSNLCVETKVPLSDAQLRYELKKECKKQDKEYGYFFKSVTGGYTMTGDAGTINSFNITPVEVYRVYVDGRPDELVRGVSLIGTPLSMFSHIKFGGDTPSTFTGFCGAESGWVPVTASSPELFVTQIETQRMQKSKNTPPILGAPVVGGKLTSDASETDVIKQAMLDEMHRSLDSLNVNGQDRPFWVNYLFRRIKTSYMRSELGGIYGSNFGSWHNKISTQIRLGNFRNCSDLPQRSIVMSNDAGEQVDYDLIRHTYWLTSDFSYKAAILMDAQKKNVLRTNPLPNVLAKIPDMQRSAPITYAEIAKPFELDSVKMKELANGLSAIFKDYPTLFDTSVGIRTVELQNYRSSTENVNLEIPKGFVEISVKASGDDVTSNTLMKFSQEFQFNSPDEILAFDEMKAKVKKFADDCNEVCKAPEIPEYYKGPVMYEDEAVQRLFATTYLKNDKFFAAKSMQIPNNSFGERIGKKVMDERFTIRNLTSLKEYDGVPLYGHYDIDADGFKPTAEMTLVDKGIFKMMLNGAAPALYAEKSTGSSLFVNDPDGKESIMTSIGTLDIFADKTTEKSKMEKELIKAAKKAYLDYAYIVSMTNGESVVKVYQIDVKTGERKLMKAQKIPMNLENQLRKVVAVSKERLVKNAVLPTSSSIIYPQSIILNDVEIERVNLRPTQPFIIANPLTRTDK